MEFNHDKSSLAEALGISEKHLEEITSKLSTLTIDVVKGDSCKPSHVAEKIAHELSYTELIFVATQYIMDKIQSFEEHKREIVTSALKKLLRDLED